MPDPACDLLKSVARISNASGPILVKVDQMLRSISTAFQSGRCLFLGPEKIVPNGFLSRLVLEKKPLWVEEGSSFQKENVLPEEEDLLCPAFACIPLYDGTSFLGILYLGFPKRYTFSPQERDLFLVVGEAMKREIRNADLQQMVQRHEKRVKKLFDSVGTQQSAFDYREF